MADIAITCVLVPAGLLAYMQRRNREDAHELTFEFSVLFLHGLSDATEGRHVHSLFLFVFLPNYLFFFFNYLCGQPFLKASVLRIENGGVPLRTSTHPRG